MAKLFAITRHKAAREFLEQEGFTSAEVLEHVEEDFFAGLNSGDAVVGTLPLHLAQRVCEATGNEFGFLELHITDPAMRGRELSLEEMRACNACVRWYWVEEGNPPRFE